MRIQTSVKGKKNQSLSALCGDEWTILNQVLLETPAQNGILFSNDCHIHAKQAQAKAKRFE